MGRFRATISTIRSETKTGFKDRGSQNADTGFRESKTRNTNRRADSVAAGNAEWLACWLAFLKLCHTADAWYVTFLRLGFAIVHFQISSFEHYRARHVHARQSPTHRARERNAKGSAHVCTSKLHTRWQTWWNCMSENQRMLGGAASEVYTQAIELTRIGITVCTPVL